MSSYPVAYRRSSAGRGFQDGPSVAFLDTSKLPPEGAVTSAPSTESGSSGGGGGLPVGLSLGAIVGAVGEMLRPGIQPGLDPAIPDRIWPDEINEDAFGADWPDRGFVEDDPETTDEQPYQWLYGAMGLTYVGAPCAPSVNHLFDCGWGRTSNSTCASFSTGCAGVVPGAGNLVARFHSSRGTNVFPDNVHREGPYWTVTPRWVPGTWPKLMPVPTEVVPDDKELEVPYVDETWDLPVKGPGVQSPPLINWPGRPAPRRRIGTIGDPNVVPFPGSQPSPAPRPALVPGPVTLPGTGVIITVGPDGTGTVTQTQTQTQTSTGGALRGGLRFPHPPNAGEKEGKPSGRSAVFARAMLNMVTEFGDFVDALWKALDKGDRKPCKKLNGKRGKCSTLDKILQLGDALYDGKLDAAFWKEAFIQLATNEIVDQFYGRAGRAYAEASKRVFQDERGFQTGGSQRKGGAPKKLGGESVSDYVEGHVRNVTERVLQAAGY